MIELAGYQVTKEITRGPNTIIYRGIRNSDQQKIIVKVLRSEYPPIEEITRLRQEYQITQILKDVEGIVKSYSLEKYQKSYALVLEDVVLGHSLKELLAAEQLRLREMLRISIDLAETLKEIHKFPVIHKDIKPSNIIVNNETGQVKLSDFGIASQLSRENPSIGNPNFLEGTLAYMSPEQTGRMNRGIDYRTDYYALGATLYEMLTGRVPFVSEDPMELVHSHLAIKPVSPHKLKEEVPEAVSAIAMKLLAKNAEDRYQSAEGLKYDLEKCVQQLTTRGKIEYFNPGERDRGNQLLIPEKLYGREAEVRMLLDAFERVSGSELATDLATDPEDVTDDIDEGEELFVGEEETVIADNLHAEMMLVSGYSGIGKTAIVNEVHKPIVRQRGYFISGKFDQFKRNIPYAAIIQAFTELVRQLLTESDEIVEVWKENLLAALGPNGQVIIDVIPEIELIIDTQPEVPQLGPSESQNRFNRVFQQFVRVLAKPEHPLVVFLDDLQWADSASLKLIELLITDADSKYLLLIGAYRDNEVSPTHPTVQTIEKIQAAGATVNNIVVKPLDLTHVSQLVAETLGETKEEEESVERKNSVSGSKILGSKIARSQKKSQPKTQPLAELLFQKTQGNPFFLTQLLKSLYAEKLLVYQVQTDNWDWDIGEIQALGITDYNVVELIARNIEKLPDSTQKVIKQAACIGNQFSLEVLAIANQESETVTAAQLWEALQAGLILPKSKNYKIPLILAADGDRDINDELFGSLVVKSPSSTAADEGDSSVATDINVDYKFLHDRVQQAAYSLIPEEEKKETHLQIGQLLLANTTEEEREENIFALVNQLNYGIDLLTKRDEKEELARLNLLAGRKAKVSAAYEASVNYLNVGMGLLETDSWETSYELTYHIYFELVEAEYLDSNFERSNVLAEVAMKQAKTMLEKVNIYQIIIQSKMTQSMMLEALELGRNVIVEMLGVELEKELPKIECKVEELAGLPEMTDPHKLAALRILEVVLSAAFVSNNAELFLQSIFTGVYLCFNYGNSKMVATTYALCGVVLCDRLKDIEKGYGFGILALKMLEQWDARELKSKTFHIFYTQIKHWKEPVKGTLEPLLEAFQSGLETGELLYSGYAVLAYCSNLFSVGEHLDLVEQKQRQYLDKLQKLQLIYHVGYGLIGWQLTLNLLGRAEDKLKLIGEAFNESETLPILIENNIGTSLVYAYLAKAMLAYLFKEPRLTVAFAREGVKYQEAATGFLITAENNFYYSLALLADYPKVKESEQREYLTELAANQETMKNWAYHAPMNFQHKYDLIEAEKARVLGDYLTAINLYEKAIQGSREQGYTQEEALANELAAEFHLERDQENMGRFYIIEAYYGYIRWGAIAKIKDLEARYPQYLLKINQPQSASNVDVTITNPLTTTTAGGSQVLDFPAIMKASQMISRELLLDKLLEKLIKIAIENAGATSGILIIQNQGQLFVEAAGKVQKGKEEALSNDEDAKYVARVMTSTPIEESEELPLSVLNYVIRTQKSLVMLNASTDARFAKDPYIQKHRTKSLLCVPIVKQRELLGMIYLENNLIKAAFTSDRVQVLRLLCSQAAISIENARLYETVQESEAREREKAEQLEKSLLELKQTQLQLVQSEKMSTIGQLVAGVAHEINNPVGFIAGNLDYATEYTQDLIEVLQLYQQHYPHPHSEIEEKIEEVELEYLVEDLPGIISSMKTGTDRIRDISTSLRTFSRSDTVKKSSFNLHEGIDSTLLILKHRLKASEKRPEIETVLEYGDLPKVLCYPGQLSQVFMNLIANAIDAMDEFNVGRSFEEIEANPNRITIRTQVLTENNSVLIGIKDNGPGMSEEVKEKLFNYLFTTKPAGKGTGLGLSISHQIVEEKHAGKLSVISAPGEGAEFVIEIPIS